MGQLKTHGLSLLRPLHSFPVQVPYSPLWLRNLTPNEIVTLEELAISSMWEMALVIDLP